MVLHVQVLVCVSKVYTQMTQCSNTTKATRVNL